MSDDEKQLLTFCTASVDLYARSIVDPATVNAESIQKDIQSFISKMDKSKAMNIGKIMFCLELQYRNAAVYEQFTSTKKKIEDAIEEIRSATSSFSDGAENPPSLASFQRHSAARGELTTLTANFLKYYTSCFPLRHRVRYAPSRLSLSPICSFKSNDFEIDASQEYLLLEKQQLKWKVQAREGSGPEVISPSIFFFIHWLSDDAEAIQRLFDRTRDVFTGYVSSLSAYLGKELKQPKFSSALTAKQFDSIKAIVMSLPENPENITKKILTEANTDILNFLQQTNFPNSPETQLLVFTVLHCISTAIEAYKSVPETVPDRSKVVFNKRLRIDGQKENDVNADKLVRIEWKMELVLNKCVTTTETTEIIPKHVDVDRFKQTEQETERKMVIQAVVDPVSDTEISLDEAIKRGIVDYSTGTYNDTQNKQQMTIDEAIMRGLILVEFVAVQASEEKHKSYGIITVEDPSNETETHYIVHVAIDRKENERLDFEVAVDRKILDLDLGIYWDTLQKESVPIADAIEKGFLKGRKVDNTNELQELAKSQADIVKNRLKKLTSTVNVLKGLGIRKF